jgi:hypothetical protein
MSPGSAGSNQSSSRTRYLVLTLKIVLYFNHILFGCCLNYFLGAFFLPATVLRFPLRVRLLVRVR